MKPIEVLCTFAEKVRSVVPERAVQRINVSVTYCSNGAPKLEAVPLRALLNSGGLVAIEVTA